MNIWNLDHRKSNEDIRNVIGDLQSNNDLYYLAGLLMRISVDKYDDNDLPGLFSLLESNLLLDLISMYGGKTIKIPTFEELVEIFKLISIIYYYDMKDCSFSDAMRRSGYTYEESHNSSLRNKLIIQREKFLTYLKEGVNGE